jgi:hypothetical protein
VAAGGALWTQQARRLSAPPAHPHDAPLLQAAANHGLTLLEVLAITLAAAVEDDPVVGRMLSWLQAPQGGARPTLALLARALRPLAPQESESALLYALALGPAVREGWLLLGDDAQRPLCDRSVWVPAPVAAALAAGPHLPAHWPGSEALARQASDASALAHWPALGAQLDDWAERLQQAASPTLVLRSASVAEARAVASALADRLGAPAAQFAGALPAGAEAWLALTGQLPVLALSIAPGEVHMLAPRPAGSGPLLVLAGLDGGVHRDDGPVADWRIPQPNPAERAALWQALMGAQHSPATADAAQRHRTGLGPLAEHVHLTRLLAAGAAPDAATVARAAAMGSGCRTLDGLALALPEPVPEGALVLGPTTAAELQRALQRCAQREQLHTGLGHAARTRASDGVRLLFTGASGTGKSLAAQWLASRLGLPVQRVDLAATMSKWIGETEKNLSALLARAEHADVVLLFDEADALFGKRTEVANGNDRFANAQTNFLLQRIESHSGIVVLTSNSRTRFDPAFVRRLDFIIDFPPPDAQARRGLWTAHLGEAGHALDPADLNRLAAGADLPGGHIRNAVLAAQAQARASAQPLAFNDLVSALQAEYRKLGRTAPAAW